MEHTTPNAPTEWAALTEQDREFIRTIRSIVEELPANKQERFVDWIVETARLFADCADIDRLEAHAETLSRGAETDAAVNR